MNINRDSRNAVKRMLLRIHKLGIKCKIHILPVHYYSPVPNIYELDASRNVWAKKSDLHGISINLDDQCDILRTVCLPFQHEYTGNRIYREGVLNHFGPGYGYIEAQALHAFMRHYKPQRVIEVGCGVSTWCMLKASELNGKETGQYSTFTCIEPYPSAKLRELQHITLLERQVQTVPLECFNELQRNDLLFIDSSHTVKAGSDVNYLYLEVLPRLKPGVIVHIHDIFLPYDYQRDVLNTFLHWNEVSLLHALLIYNPHIAILTCLSHLHYERTNILKEVFPEYKPQHDIDGLRCDAHKAFTPREEHFPSSIYIQIQ